ncbi:MAG: helix-turn-helix domain-containing protein [Cyanobacteria bacterium J06632_22]
MPSTRLSSTPAPNAIPLPEDCLKTQCPIQFVLDLLGSKWSILILRELWDQNRRTHALLKALPGISTKTLTHRLRDLETHGLVERRVYAEVPPRVEYTLTAKGKELQPVFTALYQVGRQWLEQEVCDCPIKAEPS